MKPSALRAAAVLAGTALDSQALLVTIVALGILGLLIYAGIALPAVWSAKPARRRAAACVLGRILDILRR